LGPPDEEVAVAAVLSAFRVSELQRAILGLSGVRTAHVAVGPSGDISVRVVVGPERSQETTVGDVRKIASAKFGLRIDAQQVRVVRPNNDGAVVRSGRPRLSSISVDRQNERFDSRVTLEFQGRTFVGEGHVPEGEQFENRSIARATLKAITQLMSFPAELEAVEVLKVGANRLAVVTLSLESETLVGSARVKRDEYQAIVRATLDALNRSVSTKQ
jgi:hypothetical protein